MSDAATAPAGTLPVREFFSLDLRSLALFRVALGVMLLIDWVDRLPDLVMHFSDQGVVPRRALAGIQPLSVHIFSGDAWFQAALAFVALAAALALLVGWRTPLACLVSWFLLISVHGRNPAAMQGGDHLIRMISFWGIFLPLGARYSLDAARPGAGPPNDRLLSAATFAYVVQIVVVYFFAAIWKWADEWHVDGTAVYLALRVEPFTTRVGHLFLLWPEMLRALTHATMWLESLGPVLLFLPFNVGLQRMLAVSLFVLFHLGLTLTLELGSFPWVCMVAWLPLLPGSLWDRVAAALRPAGEGLTLVHDPDSSWASDATAGFRSLLMLWQAKHEPADASLALQLRQHDGWGVRQGEALLTGSDALAALVAASPLYRRLAPVCRTGAGRWLVTLPGRPWTAALALRGSIGLSAALLLSPAVFSVGPVVLLVMLLGVVALLLEGGAEYLVVLVRTQLREKAGQPAEPTRPAWTPPGGYVVSVVILALLTYVVLYNVRTFGSYRAMTFNEPLQRQAEWHGVLPNPNLAFGQALGIDQGWGLFAPRPGKLTGWYFVVGIRADGSRIDLLDGGKVVDDFSPDSKPKLPAAAYSNGRWRKIMMHLSAFDHSSSEDAPKTHSFPWLLGDFSRAFYHDWNAQHPREKVVAVEIIYWKEETRKPGEEVPPPQRMALVHYELVGDKEERFVYYPHPMPARPGKP